MSDSKKSPCVEILWRIENFSWSNKHKEIESPDFVLDTLNGLECSLMLEQVNTSEFVSLYAKFQHPKMPVSENPLDNILFYEFSILDEVGMSLSSSLSEKKELISIRWTEIWERNEEYFPRDTLTIRCCGRKTIESEIFQVFIRSEMASKSTFFFWDIENFSEAEVTNHKTVPIKLFPELAKPPFRLSYLKSENSEEIVFDVLKKTPRKLNTWNLHIQIYETKELFLCTPDFRFVHPPLQCIRRTNVFIDTIEWLPVAVSNVTSDTDKRSLTPLINHAILLDRKCSFKNDTLSLECEFTFTINVLESPYLLCGLRSTISPPSWANFFFDATPSSSQYQVCKRICRFHPSSLTILQEDWSQVYTDQFQSDFTIQVQSHKYPVHSLVLSARSPVFRKMFESKMKESIDRNVLIEDLEPDTVTKMLNYIYTGEPGEMTLDGCLELFYAGEKYQMACLKNCCVSFLRDNLRTNNACVILKWADQHQEEQLKYEVVRFISRHERDVIFSRGWRSLMESNTSLTSKTMLTLSAIRYSSI